MATITIQSPIKIVKSKNTPALEDLNEGQIALSNKWEKPKIFGNIDNKIIQLSGVGQYANDLQSPGEIFNDFSNLAPGDYSHVEGSSNIEKINSVFNNEYTLIDEIDITAKYEVMSFSDDLFEGLPENIKSITTPIKITEIQFTNPEPGNDEENLKSGIFAGIYKHITINDKTYTSTYIDTTENLIILIFNNGDKFTTQSSPIPIKFNNTHSSEAYASHTEGMSNISLGDASHTEGIGNLSTGEGSHSEGNSTRALNKSAHAEGEGTISAGIGSHSEGNGTSALSDSAHAEGENTSAENIAAHASGQGVLAKGVASHSCGVSIITNNIAEMGVGQFNISSTSGEDSSSVWKNDSSATLFSIGNGSSDEDRKNAFEIKQDGTIFIQKPSSSQMINLQEKLSETITIKMNNVVL